MKLHYVVAVSIASVSALPALAQTPELPNATVTSFCSSSVACQYQYALGTDPSLGAGAETFQSNGDTAAGSGFVSLDYYYAIVAPAGVSPTYVPVTLNGTVTTMASGVDGDAQATIDYANGGVSTENYGAGLLTVYAYSYAPSVTSASLDNTVIDVLSSVPGNLTALELGLFVDVNAGTGGLAHGTSSASAGADPTISLSPALLAEGYSIELSPNLTAVPLPSTWWVLLSGVVGLGWFAHRGAKQGAAVGAAV